MKPQLTLLTLKQNMLEDEMVKHHLHALKQNSKKNLHHANHI